MQALAFPLRHGHIPTPEGPPEGGASDRGETMRRTTIETRFPRGAMRRRVTLALLVATVLGLYAVTILHVGHRL